jgi:2-polyprenyl-6-methoxyphenol hydroxylase-like FAD-dependent oxidoreductase
MGPWLDRFFYVKRIAIIGGGIGGLATALALKQSDCEVVILERDAEPPKIAPGAAFDAWARPGVPQFKHAHILLSRVYTLLRDQHPELLAELREAGLELSELPEVLPPTHQDSYRPAPGDGDLLHLWGRRPTFEYVLRRHVGALPNVRFVHSTRVVGLLTEPSEHRLRVHGVELARSGSREVIEADVVIDASGKQSKCPQWLEALGVRVAIVSKPSGFVYSCRHYRLNDPHAPLPRRNGGGNLDFLGYATFYAEHGNYALTFGCPVEDKELADIIRRNEGFEALCARFPVLEQWTQQSVVTSRVLGAGRFENRWTRYGGRGSPELIGFFPLGDAHLETNPMYGKGCAAAFVQAEIFARVLNEISDPGERAKQYYERTRQQLQAAFDLSVTTDRMYHIRARLKRGLPLSPTERFLSWGYESGWLPALNASPLVAREMVKAMQMREISSLGVRLTVMFKVIIALMGSWFRRTREPQLLAAPPRSEFLRSLPASNPESAGAPSPGLHAS